MLKTRTFRFLHCPLFLLLIPTLSPAQSGAPWSVLQEEVLSTMQVERRIVPARYRVVAVDVEAVRAQLANAPYGEIDGSSPVIELPRPDGATERFRFVRNTLLHPELSSRYPDIITCTGSSIDRPGVTAKLDITMHGFHAMVLDPGGSWFMDPYAVGVPEAAVVYWRRDHMRAGPDAGFSCSYDAVNDMEAAAQWAAENIEEYTEGARAGDCMKRTFRLALACTGEYANYHGSTPQNNNKGPALAAMATTMNRVNGLFERDATLTMQLVANNDALVFLNPSTDPYSNNDGGAMLSQNQTTCNQVIGFNNYDIGHVFSTGGGGVAYLDSPCSSLKAGGVTGSPNPVGDPFDVDYVAHEMGHQYGANHTQHNPCNRHGPAAREPGSASTIMGYAGICSPNVQNNSDALFHSYSLQEIASRLASGSAGQCPQVTSSNNQAPSVTGGPNRTIPHSTPFVLTASGSDPNSGDALTYTWEQMNQQNSNPVTHPPQPNYTAGPNFRANLPTTSPSRYFPALSAVVNNQTPTWEVLPNVGRTLNFRTMVRDNRAGAGCTAEADRVITVSGSAGPFVVTQPNTNVSWPAGSTQTVTWNVAGTNVSPVNCSQVDILLSVDGGYTYPYTLITATPNDGSQTVTLPAIAPTNTARIMVRANGNVFYDISNTNFTITANVSCPVPANLAVTTTSTNTVSVTWTGAAGATYQLRYRPQGSATWTTLTGITTPSQAVSGLQTCTTYEFQVQRQCPAEVSGWSDSVTWLHEACCTPVTINVATDRYGEETTWAVMSGNTVLASGGPYTQQSSSGSYPQPSTNLCLPNGCYTLVVNDIWGDGLCCAYGSGFVNVTDGSGNVLATTGSGNFFTVELPFCVSNEVKVNAKVFLDGPYVGPLMSDGLRTGGHIPSIEPYTALGWPQVMGGGETIGAGVLSVTGSNAIVDWVRLELRQSTAPYAVVATRQALLQRDGDIVSAQDGTSPVSLVAPPGNYRLAVRHRNHLGVMTNASYAFSTTPVTIDLTVAGTATYGGTTARKTVGNVRTLWAGDVTGNGQLKYTGSGNDREPILQLIGGTVPTATTAGYHPTDVNMDGQVKYTGANNDREIILQNVGGTVPTATRNQQLP